MTTNCNTTSTGCKNICNGGGFAFILVLFILIVLVGAAWIN